MPHTLGASKVRKKKTASSHNTATVVKPKKKTGSAHNSAHGVATAKPKKKTGSSHKAGTVKSAVTPAKAKKILKDGAIGGKALTQKQRGMFGAMANKSKKKK